MPGTVPKGMVKVFIRGKTHVFTMIQVRMARRRYVKLRK